jgi:hypothetical protein
MCDCGMLESHSIAAYPRVPYRTRVWPVLCVHVMLTCCGQRPRLWLYYRAAWAV